MKRWTGILIMILICYLLQTTVLQSIQIGSIVPNLLIILLVAIAYRHGKVKGMIAGFLIGLLVDLVEGSVVGREALIYMLIGYGVGFSNRIYYHDETTVPLVLVALSDFVYNFLTYVIGFLLRSRLHFFFYLRTIILPELLYTVVLSVFLFRLLHKLLGLLEPKRQEEL